LETETRCYDPALTTCVFCQCANIRSYDRDYLGNTISLCPECGVKFLNPVYTDDDLAEFYAHYYDHLLAKGIDTERLDMDRRAVYYNRYYEMVEKFHAPGRLLGVGCGDGGELDVARQRGWQVEGQEVDSDAASEVAERLGVTAHSGDFAALDLPENHYDCVFMQHVIEHPKDPRSYIEKVHSILKPGGIYFLSTPNIASLSSVYKTAIGRLGLKKRRGRHYDTFHHLFYYSPKVMRGILENQFGFEVLYHRSGAEYRPKRSRLVQHLILNHNILPLKSTFLMIARKPK
jgi:SAM-dependent methyltransferase